MQERVKPETTLAVILGASEFPRCPIFEPSSAFGNSATDFVSYLTGTLDGFGLPSTNLLNLFDIDKSPAELDRAISDFLIAHGSGAKDVIIYYVGHGGFTTTTSDYYLALRSTSATNPGISSFRIFDLAQTLKETARHLRRYIILDSCFAAAAHVGFMSSPVQIASLKTLEAFPKRGTALLCSSGPRDPSKAPRGERYTMFSGAMLEVLRKGSPGFEGDLSLEELGFEIKEVIRRRYADAAVKPEVHSPEQREGDIVSIPLFPNPAVNQRLTIPTTAGWSRRVRREIQTRWSHSSRVAKTTCVGAIASVLIAASAAVWHSAVYWIPRDPVAAVVGFYRTGGKPEIPSANTAINDALERALHVEGGFDVVHGSDVSRVKLELGFPESTAIGTDKLPEFSASLGAALLLSGEYDQWNEADGTHFGVVVRLHNSRGTSVRTFREVGKNDQWHTVISQAAMDVRKEFKKNTLSQGPLTELANLYPGDEQARRDYFLGLELASALNAKAALQAFRQASSRAPENALVHSAMADAWEKLRYDKEAGREGTKATELASHQQIPTEYKLFIEGRAAEVNKRWKTALDTYQFLRHLYPRGIVYGLRLASVQIANSDGGGALRTLGDLRQLPHPFGDDPRIDITEAEAHESLGSHEQAITAARQAIAGAKQRSAGLLEANANLTLCWASRSLGRYEDAFLACDAAQRDFKKFHDNVSAAVARNRMAALAVDQGDFKAATEAYDDVVQTTRDADAKQDQAGALVNAAGVMIRQRAPDKARSYLQESLQISVPIDDKYDQALAHILLADISAGEGRYTDAKAEVTIAHTLAKTIDDRSTQAYALSNLGQYQSELGELDNALLSFQSALDLRTALHEQPGIAACHSNMGDISYHRGDLDAAEQHYRDALEQYSNLDEQGPNVARLRLSLATIALERGNRKDAISSAERAIAQFRRQNDKDAESEAASVLVRAFVGEGQTQQASPYFARIQEIDSEDVDVRLEGAIARAEFLAASKQHLEAKRILQSAIEQASSTQEKFALMQARLTLLRLERDDNNHPAHWRGELTRIRREAAKAGFGLITRSADSL